jgi:hypothetical protein
MEGLMDKDKLKQLGEKGKKALIDVKQGAQETIKKIKGNVSKGNENKDH